MKPFNKNSNFVQSFSYKLLQVTLAAFVAVFALNSCGIAPEGDDSEQAQNRKSSDKLRADYGAFIGQYKGVLSIKPPVVPGTPPAPGSEDARDLTGQLSVYIITVSNGQDRTGAPLSYPQLVAQLKFDGVGELDDTAFSLKIDKFSGDVEFTQVADPSKPAGAGNAGGSGTVTACPVGPKDPRLTMQGRILNGQFQADVTGTSGYLGRASMTRTSTADIQPIRDQRERLLRAFAKISGTWSGASQIRNPDGKFENGVTTNIYLYTEEVDAGQGITCPVLRSQFRLPDIVGRLEDTYLNVSYREGTGELFLTYTNPPAEHRVCSVGPTDNKLSFTGSFDGKGNLAGLLKGSPGEMGNVQVAQKSKVAAAPDDQRERIYAAYNQIAGTYAGKYVVPGQKYAGFPVWIEVNVVDTKIGDYLTCPTLKGQYRRPDLVSNAGSLVLNAQFLPFTPRTGRLTLESMNSDGTGGIPGHTYLKATTTFKSDGKNASFNGDMQWWQTHGNISTVKCANANVSREGKCK